MKTLLKIMVAAIVATGMACVLMMHDASENVVILTTLCVAIIMAALLGVFDMSAIKRDMKHTSIKDAARYGQAAIFVGTAAIFVGTPQVCEELADSMQHYAQQCEVRALDGTETFEIL